MTDMPERIYVRRYSNGVLRAYDNLMEPDETGADTEYIRADLVPHLEPGERLMVLAAPQMAENFSIEGDKND